MRGGGTEAFPDLGMHCQHPECRQIDFLPFKCDSCRNIFCLEHRLYKAHACPKSDVEGRKVVVCETCSMSIETTGCRAEEEKAMLERHEKSGDCDPKKKKKKPTCAVRRCREILSFSNTSTCKTCNIKVCLRHRHPADHACKQNSSPVANPQTSDSKFLIALAMRNDKSAVRDCAKEGGGRAASPPSTPSVKVC